MMTHEKSHDRIPTFRIAIALAGVAAIGGALSLAGWVFDIQLLTDLDGDGIATQPNAALLATLSGVAVMLVAFGYRKIVAVLGATVSIIGVLTLLQHLTGFDFGIDRLLLFGRSWGSSATTAPGRMGPFASTSNFLLGASLFILAARPPDAFWRRLRRLVPLFCLAVSAIMLFAITGYLSGARSFHAIPWLSAISLQTAILLGALSLSIFAITSDLDPTRTVISDSNAGALARRLLPALIVLPLLLGWIRTKGAEYGVYDEGTGRALLIMGLVTLSVAILWSALLALQERERRERSAVERTDQILGSITDAFFVLDREFRFTFVNDEMVRRAGVGRDQIIGRTIWEMFPEATDTEAHARLTAAMENRASAEYEFEFLPTNRRYRDKSYPTAEGGLAVYSQDVTERKATERALVEAESRFRRAADAAGAIVYEVDLGTPDPVARAYGVGHILGADPGSTLTSGWWHERIHPDDRHGHLSFLNSRLDDPNCSIYQAEYRVRREDGTFRTVKDVAQIERASDASAVRIVGSIVDTTESKEAEHALREADRRKDVFLATLAHELRNPLAPIRNAVQILKTQGPANPELVWGRDVIDRQVDQLARLLDDLLDVSRISRDRLELRKELVQLKDIVDRAIETSRPLIADARHRLSVSLPSQQITIEGDPARLVQIIANLLNNAAKYTDREGSVELSAHVAGDRLTISVQDNGVGIEPGRLNEIFGMFAQEAPVIDRSKGGLGVGLALSRGLAEMHGGTLTAKSDGVGHGSEFILELPIVSSSQAVEELKPPVEATVEEGIRILVVDDNEDSAESLALFLRIKGKTVRTAHDGFQALELAEAFRPKIVLLDIGMPGLNGYETCARMREQPWGKDLLIIAQTGWGQQEDRDRAKEAGFDGHLVKPVDPIELFEIISAHSNGENRDGAS